MTSSPVEDPSHPTFSFEESQTLFVFTSLTAGSSHVITATSRLETILKANRIPFRAIDTATNEKARRIWGRRAGKRKLPGLVREGWILADYEEVEEWNEYGELKEQLANASGDGAAIDSSSTTGVSTPITKQPTSQGLPTQAIKDIPATSGGGITISLPVRDQNTKPAASEQLTASKPSTIRLNTTSPTPSRDMSDITSPSETSTKHNTNWNTALPPIRMPSNSNMPTTPKPTDFTKSPNVPDPPSASANADKDNVLLGGVPTDSAGPASKSGLDAVTSNPESSDATVAAEQNMASKIATARGRTQDRNEKESNVDGGDNLGISERIDSFDKGAPGAKVKWTEDQLKGDAKDGEAAETSVGD